MKSLIAMILIFIGLLFGLIPFALYLKTYLDSIIMFIFAGIGGLFILIGIILLIIRFLVWAIKD